MPRLDEAINFQVIDKLNLDRLHNLSYIITPSGGNSRLFCYQKYAFTKWKKGIIDFRYLFLREGLAM